MEKDSYERYKWVQAQLETDWEYLHLMERLRENTPAFQAALNALTQEHREAVIEHIGICGELAERTTEIACFGP